MNPSGMVYLVGAGPGDMGLLTLRGAELLRRANVVVHDGLVNPALLQWAAPNAEIVYGGKHDRTRAVSQDDLNALLVEKAREGKCVVRLKGGDPYVLGRGGEEAEKLAEAGIAFEVVPGVSSAEAASNYAGIPLTHRDYCSSYTVVTGHEDPDRDEARLDWARLAQIPGTLVVLMGFKRLHQIAELLRAHGRPPETPVALIRWGTTGRQQVLTGTLADIADQAAHAQLKPPVVIVIGEVVKLRAKLNWFEKCSLFGRRVAVTQPRAQTDGLAQLLRTRGADVLEVPAMRFVAPADPVPLGQALAGLRHYDWIIFSSPTSIQAFFDGFFAVGADWRELGNARLAAYGLQTAAKLREYNLRVDAVPTEHLGPPMAEALALHGSIQGRRILLLRPESASQEIPRHLRAQGAIVEDVACYQTVVETEDVTGAAANLIAHGADWLTFAGLPEVKYFQARFDLVKLVNQFPNIKLATIGPKTSQQLADLGLKAAAEAATPTIEALVEAIECVMKRDR
jgi:uroporphyrinogen III methyltransferase / synthase